MTLRFKTYSVILISLLIFRFEPALGSKEIKVLYPGDAGREEVLAVEEKGGVSFVSGRSLARLFEAKTFYSSEKGKLDVKLKDWRIKLSARSSYVVVESREETETEDRIMHMPLPAIAQDGDVLVPIEGIVEIMDAVMPGKVKYDRALFSLEISLAIANITGVRIQEKVNGTLLKIATTREFPSESYRSWINKKAGWLYLTVYNGLMDSLKIASTEPVGVIRRVVPVQLDETAQISFRLSGDVGDPEIYQTTDPNEIVISLRSPVRNSRREVTENLFKDSQRWLIDNIVIDAGHGGKDPGSIGPSGLKEKDVCLSIAKRLGRLLEKRLDVKVTYTREEDIFVPLEERTKIANRSGGKLFISIHANDFKKNRRVGGFEVYLLRPGLTESAIEVAERENSVLRFEEKEQAERFTRYANEKLILASLAQAAFMRESEDLAGMLVNEMGKKLKIDNRGVKQAGFYVLVGASMPNALIEASFISNRKEEKLLKSTKFKQSVAEAIYEGIRMFKHKYEQMITTGESEGK